MVLSAVMTSFLVAYKALTCAMSRAFTSCCGEVRCSLLLRMFHRLKIAWNTSLMSRAINVNPVVARVLLLLWKSIHLVLQMP